MEVSDVMGMREALESISARASVGGEFDPQAYLDEIHEIAEKALAVPLRNCDVGGFNKQQKRFVKWCVNHPDCERCIIAEIKKRGDSCELIWAQMRYGAPEAKEEVDQWR